MWWCRNIRNWHFFIMSSPPPQPQPNMLKIFRHSSLGTATVKVCKYLLIFYARRLSDDGGSAKLPTMAARITFGPGSQLRLNLFKEDTKKIKRKFVLRGKLDARIIYCDEHKQEIFSVFLAALERRMKNFVSFEMWSISFASSYFMMEMRMMWGKSDCCLNRKSFGRLKVDEVDISEFIEMKIANTFARFGILERFYYYVTWCMQITILCKYILLHNLVQNADFLAT